MGVVGMSRRLTLFAFRAVAALWRWDGYLTTTWFPII
jgi:hypothetical protein